MKIPGFISGQSESESKVVANEITRNLFVEVANGRPVMIGRPGLLVKWTLGSGPIRQLFTANARSFAISGATLYEIFADLSSTNRGTIETDAYPACIAFNRFMLCIASAGHTYIFTLATNVLTEIADVPLTHVRFADGYFIGLTPDSQMIRMSGQYADGGTWDPLDATSAEGSPDNLVGIEVGHRQVWCFGTDSIEPFYDSGAAAFPWERIEGALIEFGLSAKDSIIKQDNAMFWLGSNPSGGRSLWRAQGFQPLIISTPQIDEMLEGFASVSDCIGFPYRIRNHSFCVWTFPTANKTIVYDTMTRAFSEWASWDKDLAQWNRFQGQNHCLAFGMQLVGSHDSGIVYEMSPTYYDDNGTELRWLRGFPLPNDENRMVFVANPELLLEVGQGINPALPRNYPGEAIVMLRYSKDGGITFGAEKQASAGKAAEYTKRCRWPGNLGQARKPYIELSGTDPIRIAKVEFYADMEAGEA
jgi:hypothetical protein